MNTITQIKVPLLNQITQQRWLKTTEVHQLLSAPPSELVLVKTLPHQPQHGSWYVLSDVQRGWKQDGYEYLPRKNGVGVREDAEKLKIKGKQSVLCLYSYIVNGALSSEKRQIMMHRRIYRLIDQEDGYRFVHYQRIELDESDVQQNETYDVVGLNSLTSDLREQDNEFQVFESDSMVMEGQRIYSLERQSTDNTFSNGGVELRISEYSPEWDYVCGGVKLIICYQPLIDVGGVEVQFGTQLVQAIQIQPGVFKCEVPPNEEGCVKLQLFSYGRRVDDIQDRVCLFEYRKNPKVKKKKDHKKGLINDDSTYEGEFKVRVIEKLNSLHGFLSSFDSSLSDINHQSHEFLNQSYFTYLFQVTLKVIERHSVGEKVKEFINEIDQHGFALVHYLTALGYSQVIKLLIPHNLDLNHPGLDGLTPLQIAVLLNQEEMVGFLIQQGAIEHTNRVDHLLQMGINNNKILDLLVRGVTLSQSIHTEDDNPQQWNNQEQQEDHNYLNIDDICDQIFMDQFNEELPKPTPTRAKPHKYYRNHNKQPQKEFKQDINEPNQVLNFYILYIKTYDHYQDHIKVIQKNVRGWLLRRQYLDMKYATSVLQNYIRNKIAQKHIDPDCKQKIKDTLRFWLNLKQI